MNHSTPEAPSTSPLALHHETENLTNWHDERIPFELREIGEAVHDILTPRTYTVLDSDSLHDVELALGATIGPNFIFGVKNLVGKTLRYDGGSVRLPSGTSFPATRTSMMNTLL